MLSERIFSVLSNDPALAASTNAIRPLVLKQSDSLPSITYQLEIEHDNTFDGDSGLKKATLEINIYADSLATAKSINSEIKSAIKNVSGVGVGITVYNVYPKREIEDFETEENEYRINIQFSINYSEG